jgi:hypothetical protein
MTPHEPADARRPGARGRVADASQAPADARLPDPERPDDAPRARRRVLPRRRRRPRQPLDRAAAPAPGGGRGPAARRSHRQPRGSRRLALLRDFDAYRYEAVLQAYAGPFLDGIDVGLGLDLEAWLFTTREAIARRVRSAALHRARAALAEDRRDEARRLAALAVTLRGAPEFEMDELADALPVLERLALPEAAQLRELAESYGLELERPRLGPPHRARTVGPSLQRNTAFVGREAELRELEERLRDPDARLLTLFGMGGVGKTRLALRLAERQAARAPERYPEGVVVVVAGDGRAARRRGAGDRVEAGAAGHGRRQRRRPGRGPRGLAGAARARQPRTRGRGRRDVALLLRGCPGLQLVVTSRVRLGWRRSGPSSSPACRRRADRREALGRREPVRRAGRAGGLRAGGRAPRRGRHRGPVRARSRATRSGSSWRRR